MRDFAVRVWCNCIILALTHLSLGGTRLCPPLARTGSPLTQRQLAMAADVRRLVEEWLRPPFLQGGRGRLKLAALADYVADLAASPLGSSVPPPASLASASFDATRAKFMADPSLRFDPSGYLPVFEAACWQDPRLLELQGRVREEPPPNSAPELHFGCYL